MQKNRVTDFSSFEDAVINRHQHARQMADTGRIMGYFCDFVPEELLDAAGFVPVRILGSRDSVSLADKYLQSNVCSFARSSLELVLNGTYRYFSGVVVPHSCDVVTKMYDLWAYRAGYPEFCHYLWYPHKAGDPSARTAFIEEAHRLKKNLEEFIGREVPEESLRSSIKKYNENRRLLRDIYEFRKDNAPALTGTEAFSVTISSMLMRKEEHSARLREVLAALPAQKAEKKKRPRLLLSSAVIDDLELVKAIEGLGGTIVVDDSCTGIRYFWEEVREDGDPLEAIADRYLQKIPCPRTFESGSRVDFLMKNIKDYSVDGVIMYFLRCCDAHLFQMPVLQRKLKEAGVPVLYLQGDHLTPISEEARTRIAAFLEMIG